LMAKSEIFENDPKADTFRLISLNIWGGKARDPLLEFLQRYGALIDFFCLQEVFNGTVESSVQPGSTPDIFSRISAVLPEHEGHFALAEQTDMTGLALFTRRSIRIDRISDTFVYRWKNSMEANNPASTGRNLQYVDFENGGKRFRLAHMHGLWNGQGKTDTEDRLEQSRRAKAVLDQAEGPKLLCGDFNLLPETESLGILGQGMRNMIKEYGVVSTRSGLYQKPDKFADYIITSPEIDVKAFKVLPHSVSDHLPLYLEFS
jgi:endonuclease/exonuclease/phosphatase family metal-dependent hydrolase